MPAFGVVALATDFVWDGDGPVTELDPPGPWVNPANWAVNSGYPDDTGDNVFLEDVSPSPTCTYNPSSALSVNNTTITGSSPTTMKLHVKDYALTIDGDLVLNNYAELDIDQDLTVNAGGKTRAGSTSSPPWSPPAASS